MKLFTTQESGSQIAFNMLHSCGSRIKQQTFCPRCESVVQRADLLKGYAFAKDQYVTFTPEELKALEEEGSQSIEIAEFIPLSSVDPLYYEKSYFLGPDKGGDRPYDLLARAMERTGRAALARYAARGKQYLVLIRPFEGGLLLEQLRYPAEIRAFSDIERQDEAPKDGELELAERLIEQIANDQFDPSPYHDAARERIEAAIQRKIDGEEHIAVTASGEPEAQVIDLMDALRKSLAEGDDGGDEARKGPKRSTPAKSKQKRRSQKPS